MLCGFIHHWTRKLKWNILRNRIVKVKFPKHPDQIYNMITKNWGYSYPKTNKNLLHASEAVLAAVVMIAPSTPSGLEISQLLQTHLELVGVG